MADLVICDKQDLVDIADAIRLRTGVANKYEFFDMLSKVIKFINGKRYVFGSFTNVSNTYSLKLTHNLGAIPTTFIFYTDKEFESEYAVQFSIHQKQAMSNMYYGISCYNHSGAQLTFHSNPITEPDAMCYINNPTINTITLGSRNFAPFAAACTYYYIGISEDET